MRLTLAVALLGAGEGRTVWVERTGWLMGTPLSITLAAETPEAGVRGIEAAFDSVRTLEAVLSTWRDDSDLTRINAAPVDVSLPVAAPLVGLLARASAWTRETAGAFDPGVGPLIAAWDLRGAGRRPGPSELTAARSASGIARFALDTARGTIRRLVAGAGLDAGGFGKGAALDAAAGAIRSLRAQGALLDFGGQILAMGADPNARPWTVRVADPRDRSRVAATLLLSDRSAATSAQSERFVTVAGERLGHVLDPRTGHPVPPWGGVTVVHEEALTADILSTALFVMGPDAGLDWSEARGVAALFLIAGSDRLIARCTRPMHTHLTEDTTCR